MAAGIAAIFVLCYFSLFRLMKSINYLLTKKDDLYLHNKLER
jgi:hypothetical protein